jgi:hypothetical protein
MNKGELITYIESKDKYDYDDTLKLINNKQYEILEITDHKVLIMNDGDFTWWYPRDIFYEEE